MKTTKKNAKKFQLTDCGPSPIVRKPTRLDLIRMAAAQEFRHRSSSDVMRERAVADFTLGSYETEIALLQSQLVSTRKKAAEMAARLDGLSDIVGMR